MGIFLTEIQWEVMVAKEIVQVMLRGREGMLFALVMFMAIEYLTQILVAVRNKRINSEIGLWGVVKMLCIILLVAMGSVIDVLIVQNGSMVRKAVIFFYLSYEGIQILENVTLLGVPIPMKLIEVLEQLKDRYEKVQTAAIIKKESHFNQFARACLKITIYWSF